MSSHHQQPSSADASTSSVIIPIANITHFGVFQVIHLLAIGASGLNTSLRQHSGCFLEIGHPRIGNPQISQQISHLHWRRVVAVEVHILQNLVLDTRLGAIHLVAVVQHLSLLGCQKPVLLSLHIERFPNLCPQLLHINPMVDINRIDCDAPKSSIARCVR